MTTKKLFVRYTADAEWAKMDMARRFSFIGCQFFKSEEEALASDLVEHFSVPAEYLSQITSPDGEVRYGFRQRGLSGYEIEMQDWLDGNLPSSAANGGYAVLMSGRYVGQAEGDGDLFNPSAIVDERNI